MYPGFYLYFETSHTTLVPGHNAILNSEHFDPTQDGCLSLWYHMLGAGKKSFDPFVVAMNQQCVKFAKVLYYVFF